jgi:hypothetical protein
MDCIGLYQNYSSQRPIETLGLVEVWAFNDWISGFTPDKPRLSRVAIMAKTAVQ